MIYLVEAYAHEWHRTILVTKDKDAAIELARTHDCPCGCQVWEHELNKLDKGKRIYPDWN